MSQQLAKAIAILLVVALASSVSLSLAMSIEREPVKVTHRNSGPRYDIDEVERTKLAAPGVSASSRNSNSNNDDSQQESKLQQEPASQEPGQEAVPIGHMSIRRIFLVPMMPAPRPDWQGEPDSPAASSGDAVLEHPSPFARPFWPFITPVRSPGHLFGADQASRPPTGDQDDERPAASGGEREGDSLASQGPQAAVRPIFDPIQMMVDLMHQAINGQLAPPTPNLHDLNNEASAPRRGPDEDNKENRTQLERPVKPTIQNETKEDIIELDGKKFLRKTIINRHVGENIIFMTKRLIFVPLNETDPTETTTTTTSTTAGRAPVDKDESPEVPARPSSVPAEASTTTTQASAPTTTSETTRTDPASSAERQATSSTPNESSSEEPTSSTPTTTTAASQREETTTTTKGPSWVDRVSDAIDKAAERIVEGAQARLSSASSTTKPSS